VPASPASHFPLQQEVALVHGWLSEMQVLAPQDPFSQTSVQHSVAAAQESPAPLQVPTGFVQVFSVGSQLAEQQSLCDAQVEPTSWQFCLTSTLPVPPLPPPAVPPRELSVEASPAAPPVDESSSESLPQA